jgi:hypothetical protein
MVKPTSRYAQTRDYEHTYDGMGNHEGVCRIRIYEASGRAPVVLCSTLAKNDGTSITNLAEYIAAEVLTRFFRDRLESGGEPVIWIEYYPLQESPFEHLLRVTFARYTPEVVPGPQVWRTRLGEPAWHPITYEEIEALIGPLGD